jgi:hypothetical protein
MMNFSKLLFIPSLVVVSFSLMAFVNLKQVKNFSDLFVASQPLGEQRTTALPVGYNDLFAASGSCAPCHNSMVNSQGEHIGIADDWRSSMMANAGKDPLWQAKVSHETLVNPVHKEALESVCTKCHAPVGNFNAHHSGQSYYTLDEMNNDPMALDGVQCTVCHQISENTFGNFSGQLEIGADKIIWGPFANPFQNPMIFNTGYTPVHSDHIKDSRLCGSCHTLLTNSVDLNGNPTGETFVEQSIYQEWKNSIFPQNGTSCQSCHVPQIDDPVKISAVPPWLPPRSPFGMHQFAGANVFMGQLLKNFASEIGVTASDTQLDSTITRSTRMLQHHTLELTLEESDRTNDTLFLNLNLKNRAGHKFPSGFPSRRAFVELIAITENGDTLFHSGKTDGNFNLIYEDNDFEPHHNFINSEQQVQIYEMVMGDVSGNVTTVLERAYQHLKDNRIPPAGFTAGHSAYDTVQIVGAAIDDPDFNKENGAEGSGSDQIHYHIPLNKFYGQIEVMAKVHYQTINYKWLMEMFSFTSDEINAFKSYYDNSDRTPVLVADESLCIPAGFDIDLRQGWNSLSCFITPSNDDIDSLLMQIIQSVEIIIGDDGIIYPAGGIHTITNFDPFQGYSIKMSNPEILKIRGNTLTTKEKYLKAGWTLAPVLAGCETEIFSFGEDFLNNIEIIVEFAGWRVFWPDHQVYSLEYLSPGNAYLVKMKSPAIISFPVCN